ncbi:MAG: acyl-ACP--UDP-N-acetylglucosamine O-acyltransferase [Deltaproteobacteria bacterium]|nr:acyl-ACP--UDP-N-acetylglucosamine O-acyltransferase [Deltaproteobacteria bacterium]
MVETIHPTAVVADNAVLGDGVEIGPYCVVGDGVSLGAGSRLLAHCVVTGPAEIGAHNVVHPFAVIGAPPQERGYAGEPTRVVIGDDNVVREHATIHRGTVKGGGVTRIGSGNLLMVGVHVAHDVVMGDKVTLTNGTLLGGHVQVGSWVVTAGHVAVAPFAHVGESAFLAGGAMVERDVPPFMIAAGDRARVRAINRVGLVRRGVPELSRQAIKQAFKMLFLSHEPRALAIEEVSTALGSDPFVARLVDFIRASLARESR